MRVVGSGLVVKLKRGMSCSRVTLAHYSGWHLDISGYLHVCVCAFVVPYPISRGFRTGRIFFKRIGRS